MARDPYDSYSRGHGHGSRRRGDRQSGSDTRHYPYDMEVESPWTQSMQSPPSSYYGGYSSPHPTTSDRSTPRHRPELPEQGMIGQYYTLDASNANNYTHESTYGGYGSYPTNAELYAAYQNPQSGQTRRSEPHDSDSNRRRRTVSDRDPYGESASRPPRSTPINQGGRNPISPPSNPESGDFGYPGPPSIRQPSMRFIQGGTSAESTLDPRYQVQRDPRNFFKPGRVFATLWHEGQGSTYSNRTLLSEGPVFVGKYGEQIHSQIRRMVVYKQNGHCSWCFPIYTYNGQGVAKRGVNVQDHAIVYTQGRDPRPDPREPPMTKRPLEFVPSTPDQILDPMSRLNFGKIYTVEHNVKVLKVGHISSRSMAAFTNSARSVMLDE